MKIPMRWFISSALIAAMLDGGIHQQDRYFFSTPDCIVQFVIAANFALRRQPMDPRDRTVIRAIIKALRAGRRIEDADDMLAYSTSFALPPHAGLHRNDLACMLLQSLIGDTPTSILDKTAAAPRYPQFSGGKPANAETAAWLAAKER